MSYFFFLEPPPKSEACLLGYVVADIVDLQYCSRAIDGREMIILVREPRSPQNQYDSTTIAVKNISMATVGYIERSVAAALSPLLDKNLISVQGVVPDFGLKYVGLGYTVSCQVRVFTRVDTFWFANKAINSRGLRLKAYDGDVKHVDEIFKLAGEAASKKDGFEALEPPKQVIRSELLQHQKEGLGWLVGRENSVELPLFWEQLADGGYRNQLTSGRTNVRPKPFRGGLLADDMGLGKTLMLLSLIAYDKCFIAGEGDEVVQEDELVMGVNRRKGKRPMSGQQTAESRKKGERCLSVGDLLESEVSPDAEGKTSVAPPPPCKTTLVVCPPSVLATWETQLDQHTVAGALKIHTHYRSKKKKESKVLGQYDIVLTTYDTLCAEFDQFHPPLLGLEWRRIILDEADEIKNPNTRTSCMVTRLEAERRWAVTGTPVQKGSWDLFSLMACLHFEPFCIRSYWEDLVYRPLSQASEEGRMRLQVLLAIISLRRTKDETLMNLHLPAKSEETCFVELSSEEREFYNHMEGEAKNLLKTYIDNRKVVGYHTTMLAIILRLRQICVSMKLCPPHMTSIFADGFKDVSDNPQLLRKLAALLQYGGDLECPICKSPPVVVSITRCAHIFCKSCILSLLTRGNGESSCPLCRGSLSVSDLFFARQKTLNSKNAVPSADKASSSKVSALLRLLAAAKDENPGGKSVVFSQFQKMLVLLEEPLKQAGFSTSKLDGLMDGFKRAKIIKAFEKPGGPTVLLATLKAAGFGINLTAASTAYLLEPWWNPDVEKQAVDRVHRLGQRHHVKIVRLIARNTIEERVLELQEKKKKQKFPREVTRKRRSEEKRKVNIDDFRTLVSL